MRSWKAANSYRNIPAHGGVFHAQDPNSSFPKLGEWEIEHSKRTGLVTTAVSASDIEAREQELVDALNKLVRLIVDLPRL